MYAQQWCCTVGSIRELSGKHIFVPILSPLSPVGDLNLDPWLMWHENSSASRGGPSIESVI